jgi:hypothetical protein
MPRGQGVQHPVRHAGGEAPLAWRTCRRAQLKVIEYLRGEDRARTWEGGGSIAARCTPG